MTNPWKVSKAFDDMFVDEISIDGISYNVCVFPIEDVDPFTDSANTSDIKRINVLLRLSDITTRPIIGDSLIYENETWAIADIVREQTWYRMTARKIS